MKFKRNLKIFLLLFIFAITSIIFVSCTTKTKDNIATVTWENYDGTVLEIDENVEYGTMPSYDGVTPIKPATEEYSYTFNGWGEIKSVDGDVVYKAQFTELEICEAKIGEVTYKTLLKAIENVSNNDTIYLLKDINLSTGNISISDVIIEGNNHRINWVKTDKDVRPFSAINNCTLNNLELNFNTTEDDYYLADKIYSSTFNNVDLFGKGIVTGNVGAFCYRIFETNNFVNCDVYSEITGGGQSTNYNSAFFGIIESDATINMTDCSFCGTLKCGSAALFVANPCYRQGVTLNINNVKNNGLIQTLSTKGNINIKSPNQISASNNDGTLSHYNITIDGETIGYKQATENEQIALNGEGHFIFGPDDETLTISKNADNTLKITPASSSDISYYEVVIGVYVGLPGGSTRNYITERVQTSDDMNTTIKMLDFVDATWVENHSDASLGSIGNNKIYTFQGNDYYLVNEEEYSTNGEIKPISICAVSAYKVDGTIIASSSYVFE